jgi:DNA mismatch repair protein MutS
MINLRDVHFNEEILPLFDTTQNLFSSRALRQWFQDIPASSEEVMLRQNILKGFVQNTRLQNPFSYSKTEFNGVYAYLEDFKIRNSNRYGTTSKLRLYFNRREKQTEAGKLSQLVLFMYKANGFYFTGLDRQLFPESYQKKLERLGACITSLNIENYQSIVRKQGLKIKDITRLNDLIWEKIKSREWQFFWEEFFLFEAYLSMAKAVVKNGFRFPVFAKDKMEFRNFYHPLVHNPVKNDLVIENHVMVITGPNMSGKSTLLKAIGLCVYLGHAGMAVPADSCELIFFDVISHSAHLMDDLANGYSHFMTEIKLLKSILEQEKAGKKCFAVFDEMFKGTNEEDSLAISSLTIAGLAKSMGSYFLVSTHLHQLKSVVEKDKPKIATYCLDCDLQNQLPVFTYKLKPGWSELKIGQILFKLEGLDKLLPS